MTFKTSIKTTSTGQAFLLAGMSVSQPGSFSALLPASPHAHPFPILASHLRPLSPLFSPLWTPLSVAHTRHPLLHQALPLTSVFRLLLLLVDPWPRRATAFCREGGWSVGSGRPGRHRECGLEGAEVVSVSGMVTLPERQSPSWLALHCLCGPQSFPERGFQICCPSLQRVQGPRESLGLLDCPGCSLGGLQMEVGHGFPARTTRLHLAYVVISLWAGGTVGRATKGEGSQSKM